MKKRYVYQLTSKSVKLTLNYDGYSMDDLKKRFDAFKKDLSLNLLPARYTDIVFSSESKAKDFCFVESTSSHDLSSYVGLNVVVFIKFDYQKVEVL